MRLEIIQSGTKIQINGVVFPFDDKILIIDDMSIITPKIYGLVEFERLLEGYVTKSQLTLFLKFLLDNSQVGIKELQDHIEVDRAKILHMIKVGYDTGLMVKKGQWRLVVEIRESVGRYLKNLLPKPEDEETMFENLHKVEEIKDTVKEKRRK